MKFGLPIVALALAMPLAGCFSCAPLLSVMLCPEPVGYCEPRPGDRIVDWNPDLANLWPDVPEAMEKAEAEHYHAQWTKNQADAFWTFWQVPKDQADKQIFLVHNGQTYRVGVLAC